MENKNKKCGSESRTMVKDCGMRKAYFGERSGKGNTTLPTIEKIAQTLGIKSDELLK